MVAASRPALIDQLLPEFDEFERHERLVRAAPPAVYAALLRVDLLSSRVIRWLILLRGAPGALSRRPRRTPRPRTLTLKALLQGGFVLLGERPSHELALGAVGRFWTLGGDRLTLDADGFAAFDRPGYAKVVWDFRVTPQDNGTTRLSTETRISCLDAESRRRFRRYWRVIRPFSGLIRRALLRAVAREATR
jgi:hypothetical protein